jgi:hypothetical protein
MTRHLILWLMLASHVLAQQQTTLPSGNSRISGVVVSADTGAPLPGARVSLEANNLPSSMARIATADVNGAFDFPNIAAGTYGLKASKGGYLAKVSSRFRIAGDHPVTVADGQTADSVTLQLYRGGVITGRIADEFGDPIAQVRVYVARLQHRTDGTRAPMPGMTFDETDDLGRFRIYGLPAGDYLVGAAGRNSMDPAFAILPGPGRADIAPTYYPGTANPGEAQIISLGAGEETSVQFTLMNARLVEISGTAMTSDGRPAAGMRATLRVGPSTPLIARAGGTVSADGTFRMSGVAPGDHWIEVAPDARTPGGERGSAAVSVGADDVPGVTIVTTPGATIRGTVILDSPWPQSTLQLTATPSDGFPGSTGAVSDPIVQGGRFELRGVRGRFFIEPVGSQWSVTSVVVNGRDMGEEPLDVADGSTVPDVEVTLTDRLTIVTGAVASGRGEPLKDHLVVLLRAGTSSDLPSRRVRTVWTDEEGKFQARGLRPGSYVAGVFVDLEPGYHHSPDFQDDLRARGQSFTLGERETSNLELTMAPGLQ